MPRVWKHGDPDIPSGAVRVDRGTKWGNPFKVGYDGNRERVIEKYDTYLDWHPELVAALVELKGKDLICHCSPKACHADVLLRRANEMDI